MSFPRYPGYKDSGVEWLGEVPAHWELARMKFVAHVQTGVAKGKDNSGKNTVEVPYLRVANVQDGYFDLGEVSTIEIPAEELSRYALQAGDVLMNEGGDVDKLGRGHIWDGSISPCIHQNHVFAVRPFRVSPQWLNLVTGSAYAQFYFMSRAKQSTNLASISSSNIMELPVLLPNEVEQQTIASFLDRETAKIDALVAEQENLIGLLKEKRQAVISNAVTKGLDPSVPMKDSGVEWLGEVPAHWAMQKVKHLTSRISSGKTPLGGSETYVDEGVTFLRSQNVYDDGLRLDDVVFISEDTDQSMAVSRVIPGDILLNITGASIGRSCIVPRGLKTANVNQHVCAIRLTDESLAPFAAWIFKSALVKNQIDFAQNGAAREGLNFEQIGGMVVVMPPTCEQAAIAAFLDRKITSLDALIAEAQSAITLLQERRTALISAAVTGQIDVRGLFFAQTEEGPA